MSAPLQGTRYFRDLLLLHRAVNKSIVRQLAGDIEAELFRR